MQCHVPTSYRDERGLRVFASLAIRRSTGVLPAVLPRDLLDAQLSVLDLLPVVDGKGDAICRGRGNVDSNSNLYEYSL